MENTQNGNDQQVTYDQLLHEYTRIAQENQQLQIAYQQLKLDRTNEQLETLMKIVVNRDKFSSKTVKLAEWHIQKMIAKPKKIK